MKIVGICGSPRKQATEYVLKEALHMLNEQGFETEFFTVKGKKINFCIHCDHCLKHKECVFKDDMQEVYSLLKNTNGLIFATPVYNGNVSAQTKAIMDRCRAAVAGDRNFFKYKVGIGIALGGDRVGGQEAALQQIHTFYILNGVIPVSGGFFGANLGATFWTKDTLEGTKQDKEGFRSLKKTIKKFALLLNKYRAQ
jgi:multimeric flavodoxin WrbA